MAKKRNEKVSERAILHELQRRGWWAAHMDCGVDGFTDVLGLKYDRALLLEVKDAARSMKLDDLLESSQPIFFKKMEEVRTNAFIVIGDGKEFSVYHAAPIFDAIIYDGAENKSIDNFPLAASGSAEEVIGWLSGLIIGDLG
jgi:hypothetical protein